MKAKSAGLKSCVHSFSKSQGCRRGKGQCLRSCYFSGKVAAAAAKELSASSLMLKATAAARVKAAAQWTVRGGALAQVGDNFYGSLVQRIVRSPPQYDFIRNFRFEH